MREEIFASARRYLKEAEGTKKTCDKQKTR